MISHIISFILLFNFFISINDNSAELFQSKRSTNDSNSYMDLNNLTSELIENNPDSAIYTAHKALNNAKLKSIKKIEAQALYILGEAYLIKKLYEKSIFYSNKSYILLKKEQYTEKYLNVLFNLGLSYFNISNYDSALHSYNALLKISRQKELKNWIAISLHGIGSCRYAKGEYYLALKDLLSSSEIYFELRMKNYLPQILCMIGGTYTALSKYDHALDYLFRSLQKSKELLDYENESLSYHAIAIIYERLKNYKLALKFSKKGLHISKLNNLDDNYAHILNHTGKIYLFMSNLDSAYYYIDMGLDVNIKNKNLIGIANSFDHIGDIYLKKQEIDRALHYYEKAWEVIKNVDEKYRKSKILNHLGIVYTKNKKFDLAYKKLSQSLEIALQTNAQDLLQETLQSLSEYHAARGNYQQAYYLLTDYSQIRDSIFTVNSHHISEMQMRYETGKRDKENELLRNELEIQNLELEKSTIKTWLSFLSLIFVSIVGFFSYHRYLSKKKANIVLVGKIEKALKKQEEQQQIIFHQASLSSLGELAAGMAHEINQPLQNLQLCTESIKIEYDRLNQINEQIDAAIKEIHHDIERIKKLINHVRIFSSQQKNHVNELFPVNPVILDAMTLVSKQYLKKGIQIELDLKKNLGKLKGNPYKFEQVVINLLSNAKDAILEKQNVIGDYPKKIRIETRRKNSTIILRVIDNGIGFKKDEKVNVFQPFYTTKKLGQGTGLGLSIVYGIIKEMKGTIFFKSEFRKGTTIEGILPRYMNSNSLRVDN